MVYPDENITDSASIPYTLEGAALLIESLFQLHLGLFAPFHNSLRATENYVVEVPFLEKEVTKPNSFTTCEDAILLTLTIHAEII